MIFFWKCFLGMVDDDDIDGEDEDEDGVHHEGDQEGGEGQHHQLLATVLQL